MEAVDLRSVVEDEPDDLGLDLGSLGPDLWLVFRLDFRLVFLRFWYELDTKLAPDLGLDPNLGLNHVLFFGLFLIWIRILV